MNIAEVVKVVMARCREAGAGGTEAASLLAIAEESGEFAGAMRRWRGGARRRGTEHDAQLELADIVLAAYSTADVLGWDLDQLIEEKIGIIMSRGWKEPVS